MTKQLIDMAAKAAIKDMQNQQGAHIIGAQPGPEQMPLGALLELGKLGVLSPRQLFAMIFGDNAKPGGYGFDGFDFAREMNSAYPSTQD